MSPARSKAKKQPAACEDCGKTFKNNTGLASHRRNVHQPIEREDIRLPEATNIVVAEVEPEPPMTPEAWESMRIIAESLGKISPSERNRVMRAVTILLGR